MFYYQTMEITFVGQNQIHNLTLFKNIYHMNTKGQDSKFIFKIKYNNLMSDRTRNGAKNYGQKNNQLT